MNAFVHTFLGKKNKTDCIHIQNGGKEWIIPRNASEIGMEIYQATSLGGKLLKDVVMLGLHGIGYKDKKITIIECGLHEELDRIIRSCFNLDKYYFSCYVGDQSILENQKLVIQIFDEERILGYIKATNNSKVFQLFQNETDVLKSVSFANANVPKCLGLGCIRQEIYYYVQSTEKCVDSHVVTRYTRIHHNLLKEWKENYQMRMQFENTSLGKNYQYLHEVLKLDNISLVRGLETCKQLLSDEQVCCSFSHGDFTPWNMFFNSSELFVFDFEYSTFNRIQYYDYIHFNFQVELLHKGIKRSRIESFYSGFVSESVILWKCSKRDFECSVLFYIYDQFAFQYKRRNGLFDHNDVGYIFWTELAGLILNSLLQ